jgi:hypothetical protein
MGEITEILREARDWFAEDGHWTQGTLARRSSGAPVGPSSPAVVATCVRGGLHRAQQGHDTATWYSYYLLARGVSEVVEGVLGHVHLAAWNDDAARTAADVRDLLDKATKIADDRGLYWVRSPRSCARRGTGSPRTSTGRRASLPGCRAARRPPPSTRRWSRPVCAAVWTAPSGR